MSELNKLIETARAKQMTPAELEAQRLSFAYGNSSLENQQVTRDTVRQASETIKSTRATKKPPQ